MNSIHLEANASAQITLPVGTTFLHLLAPKTDTALSQPSLTVFGGTTTVTLSLTNAPSDSYTQLSENTVYVLKAGNVAIDYEFTALDFSNISPLQPPIKTTDSDVILSGHGSLNSSNINTVVPTGVEFWLLLPPGASMSNNLGQALENTTTITKLGIFSSTTGELSKVIPATYKAGSSVPDYTLHSPNNLVLDPNGPHLIGVTEDTKLSTLWARVTPFIIPGKTIKVFWAACTSVNGAVNQTVYYQ